MTIQNPAPGAFENGPFTVSLRTTGSNSITKITIRWNGGVVEEVSGNFGTAYNFGWSFSPASFNPQNLLEATVTDSSGASAKTSAIVYH